MRIINRKASYDYTTLDRIEAGMSLMGCEVKSLRSGHGKLEGAYVKIANGEAYLINAQIMPYSYARPPAGGYDPKRTRKLLLHKREVISLQSKLDSAKLTLIPLSWYTKGPQIKLEIGLARGRKVYEKREKKKREDQKRELEQDFRGKVK